LIDILFFYKNSFYKNHPDAQGGIQLFSNFESYENTVPKYTSITTAFFQTLDVEISNDLEIDQINS